MIFKPAITPKLLIGRNDVTRVRWAAVNRLFSIVNEVPSAKGKDRFSKVPLEAIELLLINYLCNQFDTFSMYFFQNCLSAS